MGDLEKRIAKRLLTAHGRILSNRTGDNGWWTSIKRDVEAADERVMDQGSVRVKFASGAVLKCEVAGDEKSQIVGLQKYAGLPDGYGMVFTYDEPRRVSFHMGTVAFPIDIIFVGSDGRINKIVEHIEPGTKGNWGMSHVSAVIEASGGYCSDNDIEVGDRVDLSTVRSAQYDIVDGSGEGTPDEETPYDRVREFWMRGGHLNTGDFILLKKTGLESKSPGWIFEGMMEGDPSTLVFRSTRERGRKKYCHVDELRANMIDYMSAAERAQLQQTTIVGPRQLNGPAANGDKMARKQAQEVFTPDPRKDINPKMLPPVRTDPTERFKGHDLVDVQTDSQPMDNNWDSQMGYDVSNRNMEDEVGPVRQSP